MQTIRITVLGPSASGKSTIAREIAALLTGLGIDCELEGEPDVVSDHYRMVQAVAEKVNANKLRVVCETRNAAPEPRKAEDEEWKALTTDIGGEG